MYNIRKYSVYVMLGLFATIFSGILFSYTRLWLIGGYSPNTNIVNNDIQKSVLKFVFSIIISPIIEELMFRSGIPFLLQDFCGRKKSIFLSNFIFAVVHLDWFIVPYFFNGMVYSYTFEKTNKIIIPIAIHSIYNTVVFLV